MTSTHQPSTGCEDGRKCNKRGHRNVIFHLSRTAPAKSRLYTPDRPYTDIRQRRHRSPTGLARAKAKGVRLGRKPTSPKVEERIRQLRATGIGIIKIARQLGIGVSVVQRVVTSRTPAVQTDHQNLNWSLQWL